MSQPDFKGVMRIVAAAEHTAAPLPGADLIWGRAMARAEWRRRESAMRPIRVAQWAAAVACAVTGIAVLPMARPGIEAAAGAMGGMLAGLGVLTAAVTLGAASIFLKMLFAED